MKTSISYVQQGNTGSTRHIQPLQANLSIVHWGNRCCSIVCCQTILSSPAMQTWLWLPQCKNTDLCWAFFKHKDYLNAGGRLLLLHTLKWREGGKIREGDKRRNCQMYSCPLHYKDTLIILITLSLNKSKIILLRLCSAPQYLLNTKHTLCYVNLNALISVFSSF